MKGAKMRRIIHIFIIVLASQIVSCACHPHDKPSNVRVTFFDVCGSSERDRECRKEIPRVDRTIRSIEENIGGPITVGDAILIETGEKVVLVDGGSWGKGCSVIIPYLEQRGIKTIDSIILTHAHWDHYGGLIEVLESMPVETVMTNGLDHPSKGYELFLNTVNSTDAGYRVAKIGDVFDWGNGVEARVLQIGGDGIPESEHNNNSIVVRMNYGNVHFLLSGDMEEEEENALLDSKQDIRSQILKVGHHGSRTSSSYRFIKAVRPEAAVISVGWTGRNFPDSSVVGRIESTGCDLYRTDLDGTVVVETDGDTWKVNTEKTRSPRDLRRAKGSELYYKYEGDAMAHWRKRDYKAAEPLFCKALEADPSMVSARSKLGYCYTKLERFDDAIREYQEVLKSDPCEQYANYQLGLIYYSRDKKAALDYFEKHLKCNPAARLSFLAKKKMAWIHTDWGRDFEEAGNESGAIEEFEKAIAIDDNLALPHFKLGLLYSKSTPDRARVELTRYLQLEPEGEHADSVKEKLKALKL